MSPRTARLPKNPPDGTKYVVEGRTQAGGVFRVLVRYVVLPDGRRIDLPATDLHDLTAVRPPARRRRTRARFAAKDREAARHAPRRAA